VLTPYAVVGYGRLGTSFTSDGRDCGDGHRGARRPARPGGRGPGTRRDLGRDLRYLWHVRLVADPGRLEPGRRRRYPHRGVGADPDRARPHAAAGPMASAPPGGAAGGRVRPARSRGMPAFLLQRRPADTGRCGPAAGVPGHGPGRRVDVAAARRPAPAAHRDRGGLGHRRAVPGAQPDRLGTDRPDRGDVGPARRGRPGHIFRAVGVGRRPAAADHDGLGRDVRGRGRARRPRRRRGAAAGHPGRQCPLPRPLGELDRARARAVAAGRGRRLRGRDWRGPPAGSQAGLIHRDGRGAVRGAVRLAAARPAPVAGAVPRRRVHPRWDRPGPGR